MVAQRKSEPYAAKGERVVVERYAYGTTAVLEVVVAGDKPPRGRLPRRDVAPLAVEMSTGCVAWPHTGFEDGQRGRLSLPRRPLYTGLGYDFAVFLYVRCFFDAF
jgi:hypothetical protein